MNGAQDRQRSTYVFGKRYFRRDFLRIFRAHEHGYLKHCCKSKEFATLLQAFGVNLPEFCTESGFASQNRRG